MAKYGITYKCGHTGEIQIYGPEKDRGWKADKESEKLCHTCYIQAQQAEADEIAKHFSFKAGDLPILTGTSKQISWAETIRLQKLAEIDAEVAQIKAKAGDKDPQGLSSFNEQVKAAMRHIATVDRSSWWIDRRNDRPLVILQEAYKQEVEK